MALSVSPSHLPPASISLTPSEQKPLVPQPLSDAATHALANAAPAAVYHPSENTSITPKSLKVVDNWVGRGDSPQLPQFIEIANGARSSLKAAFQVFQSTLSSTAPDLARTRYGFTVEADGALKVVDSAGQLSTSDTQRLTDLLNKSLGLKTAAVAFRNATIDMVDAGSPSRGSVMGFHSLTNENFAKTIDLGPLVRDRSTLTLQESRYSAFVVQLSEKGERATRETEEAMFARRAAQGFSIHA